jgi:hypothetical protein
MAVKTQVGRQVVGYTATRGFSLYQIPSQTDSFSRRCPRTKHFEDHPDLRRGPDQRDGEIGERPGKDGRLEPNRGRDHHHKQPSGSQDDHVKVRYSYVN